MMPTTRAADHYNRGLEKSIGQYDQTHSFKVNYFYELPFGKGKGMLNSGVMSYILGGWRIGGAHLYASGYPLALTNGVNYNMFNGRSPAHITTYEGWINTNENPNWSGGDRYFASPAGYAPDVPAVDLSAGQRDPVQPEGSRAVGQRRQLLARQELPVWRKTFAWIFVANRSTPSIGRDSIPATPMCSDQNFGIVNSTLNEPRRMQVGLKLYF